MFTNNCIFCGFLRLLVGVLVCLGLLLGHCGFGLFCVVNVDFVVCVC